MIVHTDQQYANFLDSVKSPTGKTTYFDLILPNIHVELDLSDRMCCLNMLDDNCDLFELGSSVFPLGPDAVSYRETHEDNWWLYDRVAKVVILNVPFARHTIIAAMLYNLYSGTEPCKRGIMNDALSFMQNGMGFWQSQVGEHVWLGENVRLTAQERAFFKHSTFKRWKE